MNTHDKYDLPPNPITPMLAVLIDKASSKGTADTIWQLMQEFAGQAIEADRKQRHLKEKAQLEQEWSELKHMQAQYETDRKRRGDPLVGSRAQQPVSGADGLPLPVVESSSEAEPSYSTALVKHIARTAHDLGYNTGWEHGREHGAAPPQPSGDAGELPDLLSDFQEGQWWVKELDAAVASGFLTDDQKRAVAVVHHFLRSARASAKEQS